MELEPRQEIKIELPDGSVYTILRQSLTTLRLTKNDTTICYGTEDPLSQKTLLYAVECLFSEITDTVKSSLEEST